MHFIKSITVFTAVCIIGFSLSERPENLYDISGDNCTNCWWGCDATTGNCSGDCRPGFYGYTCDQTCPSCYKCNKTSGECTQCTKRHYGPKCDKKCSEHCMVGCDITGRCYVCYEGYYGRECEFNCPTIHCKNGCERITGNCTGWGCYGGWWGNGCNETCPVDCGGGYCHQKDGTCQICKPNHSGSRCSKRCNDEHCSLCQFDVTTCYNCFNGWYGEHCDKVCPKNCKYPYCNQHTGKCQQCQHGYFGPYCDGMCDSRCQTCSENTTCDTCNPGYFGEKCDIKCPDRCQNCERDGKCRQCSADFFGLDCQCRMYECSNVTDNACIKCKNPNDWYPFQKGCCPCSEHCVSEPGKPTCDQAGKCLNGCVANYYGEKCSEFCGEHCAVGNFSRCSNESDVCLNGCEHGWYLPNCTFNCSLHFPHCAQCKEYTDRNGKNPFATCEICEPGYYSEFYTSYCKPCENCIDDDCDGRIGRCRKGCQSGWYTYSYHLCEFRCSENCIDKLCDDSGGACLKGCVNGYFKERCGSKCPQNCLNHVCSNATGDCILGCVTGNFGLQCNYSCNNRCGSQGCHIDSGVCIDCVNGFYGNVCSNKCNATCKANTCNITTGFCSQGCVPDWTGVYCEARVPPTRLSTGMIVLAVVLPTATVIVIVVIARVWYIRKRSSSKNIVT